MASGSDTRRTPLDLRRADLEEAHAGALQRGAGTPRGEVLHRTHESSGYRALPAMSRPMVRLTAGMPSGPNRRTIRRTPVTRQCRRWSERTGGLDDSGRAPSHPGRHRRPARARGGADGARQAPSPRIPSGTPAAPATGPSPTGPRSPGARCSYAGGGTAGSVYLTGIKLLHGPEIWGIHAGLRSVGYQPTIQQWKGGAWVNVKQGHPRHGPRPARVIRCRCRRSARPCQPVSNPTKFRLVLKLIWYRADASVEATRRIVVDSYVRLCGRRRLQLQGADHHGLTDGTGSAGDRVAGRIGSAGCRSPVDRARPR